MLSLFARSMVATPKGLITRAVVASGVQQRLAPFSTQFDIPFVPASDLIEGAAEFAKRRAEIIQKHEKSGKRWTYPTSYVTPDELHYQKQHREKLHKKASGLLKDHPEIHFMPASDLMEGAKEFFERQAEMQKMQEEEGVAWAHDIDYATPEKVESSTTNSKIELNPEIPFVPASDLIDGAKEFAKRRAEIILKHEQSGGKWTYPSHYVTPQELEYQSKHREEVNKKVKSDESGLLKDHPEILFMPASDLMVGAKEYFESMANHAMEEKTENRKKISQEVPARRKVHFMPASDLMEGAKEFFEREAEMMRMKEETGRKFSYVTPDKLEAKLAKENAPEKDDHVEIVHFMPATDLLEGAKEYAKRKAAESLQQSPEAA